MESIQIKDYWVKYVYCSECGLEMKPYHRLNAKIGLYITYKCVNEHKVMLKLVENEVKNA